MSLGAVADARRSACRTEGDQGSRGHQGSLHNPLVLTEAEHRDEPTAPLRHLAMARQDVDKRRAIPHRVAP